MFTWRSSEPRERASALAPAFAPPPIAPTFEPPAPPPERSRWRRWTPRVLLGILALFVLAIAWLAFTAPLSKSLQPIAPPQLTLLAADGTPIARTGAMVEAPVKARALPPQVIHAFLAIEDRRFYTHWGIDPRGLARAAWGDLTSSRTQGGSTITQQLAKFTFLTPERSMTRKAREMLIAFWLEAWLTKDEILERYLSNAYFGDNAYGLRAASLHYFRRQPEHLTVAQGAMLAGLMQAPSRYAPTHNYPLAQKRMRTVIAAMVEAKYLTPAQAAALRAPALDVSGASELPTGTYFADWAVPEARRRSEAGYTRETLTTTLDARLQLAARRAIANAPLGHAQVALVAMRPTGEVVAMIGGSDYAKSPFNRATQARRQPGSTFKAFVYLAALRNGWSPDQRIENTAITAGSYRPKNASGTYSPTITLADAFARSSNVAAVRLYRAVGGDKVVRAARDLGVTSPLVEGDPSTALGSGTMTLLELTSAYAGIAGKRNPVKASAFTAPDESWTGWLLARRHALSGGERDDMRALLRGAVERGTGRAARLGVPAYGKTGTSQDQRDALFVGFAGDLVVGVWVGNDDNTPLSGITGGTVPARIWADFMRQALGVSGATPESGPAAPPRPRPNPSGPVVPMDVPLPGLPGSAQFPVGDGGNLTVDKDGAVLTTAIGGVPVDVRLGQNGVSIDPRQLSPAEAARSRAAAAAAAAAARQRVQDQTYAALRAARDRAEAAARQAQDAAG